MLASPLTTVPNIYLYIYIWNTECLLRVFLFYVNFFFIAVITVEFFFVRYKPLLLFINCAIYLLFCLNIKKHKLTYNHSDLYVHSTFNERGRESEKHMQEIISILHTTVISAILPIILLLVFFIFMWKVQRIDYIVFRNTFLFHFDI